MAVKDKRWVLKPQSVLDSQLYYDLVDAKGNVTAQRKITGAEGMWKREEKLLTDDMAAKKLGVPSREDKLRNYVMFVKELKIAGLAQNITEAVKNTTVSDWSTKTIYNPETLKIKNIKDDFDNQVRLYKEAQKQIKSVVLATAPKPEEVILFAKNISSGGKPIRRGKGPKVAGEGARSAIARYNAMLTGLDCNGKPAFPNSWLDVTKFDAVTKIGATKKNKISTRGKLIKGPKEMRIMSANRKTYDDFIDYLVSKSYIDAQKAYDAKQTYYQNMEAQPSSQTSAITQAVISGTYPQVQVPPIPQKPVSGMITFQPQVSQPMPPPPLQPPQAQQPLQQPPLMQPPLTQPPPPSGGRRTSPTSPRSTATVPFNTPITFPTVPTTSQSAPVSSSMMQLPPDRKSVV